MRFARILLTNPDRQGLFQPTELVLLCAHPHFNVHLMLLSRTGKPRDRNTGDRVIGRNYAYQTNLKYRLLFLCLELQSD